MLNILPAIYHIIVKMNIRRFLVSICLTILVVACGKETQSSTQGGGKFVVRVKFSPSLQVGTSGQAGTSNSIMVWGAGFSSRWDGVNQSQALSEITTDEISVTSGQNLPVYITMGNMFDRNCRTVTLEGIQNGKVIKTYNLSLGYKSDLSICVDGLQANKNFIIQ